jgi:hypothetical protein
MVYIACEDPFLTDVQYVHCIRTYKEVSSSFIGAVSRSRVVYPDLIFFPLSERHSQTRQTSQSLKVRDHNLY